MRYDDAVFELTEQEFQELALERPRRFGKKRKTRKAMRDNSKNIAVHMTVEQYDRLQRYLSLTALNRSNYFRKLIQGKRLCARCPKLRRAVHAESGMIYTNVLQITKRHAKEIDPAAAKRLEFITGKLIEQINLLSSLR